MYKQKALSLTSLLLITPLSSLIQMQSGGPICKIYFCVDDTNSSTTSSSGVFKWGHSYISLFSYSSDPIKVGYYTLNYGEKVTIGLFDGYDKRNVYPGIYYNREVFTYNNPKYYPDPEHFVSSSYLIYSLDPINQITHKIKEKSNYYNTQSYNCVSFVNDIYYIVTSGRLTDSNFFPTPGSIFDDLLNSAGFIERSFDTYPVSSFSYYLNGSFMSFSSEPKWEQ